MRTRSLPIALCLLAASSCSSAPPSMLTTGDYSLSFYPGAMELRLSRRDQVLLDFPADAFQLGTVDTLDEGKSYDPYWLEAGQDVLPTSPPASLVWHTPEGAAVIKASSTTLAVALTFDGGATATLTLRADAQGRFGATLVPDVSQGGPPIAWMRLRPHADATEGFYGLGEWPDQINHRGQARPMQIELANTESANNEDHVPVPLLIGTRGWGLFVQSRRVGLFDVARKAPDLIEITYGTAQQSGEGLSFHLLSAERPLDIPKLYFDITGYPLLPALWALGPWIWRDENRDQAQVLDDMSKMRSLDLATSAIWLDRPYASGVNTFDFDPRKFNDPPQMIQAAHDQGLRMAVWNTPYLGTDAEPLRSQALSAGYFTKKSGILLNGWSDPIDFTNPAAYAFWQGLIGRYTDAGIEGFKLDYGEDIVPGVGSARNVWKFADGSDERTMHHGYTLLYHRVYAEKVPASGGYLLCRAGRWGDQTRVSVVWPGDMDASFTHYGERFTPRGDVKEVVGVGGLPATVMEGIGLSASGFPFFAADTGGYRHSPADKELYVRWFEQTALSTVMNVGDASSETPWEFTADNGRDQEALDLYRTYARLHMRLFPYEWTYAQNMLKDGRPIQRAFGLAYPDMGEHPGDTYLFGDDLLVAPVVVRGQVSKKVLLPPGDWVDFWDGTVHAGGTAGATVEVPAPLGKLPLFLRAGAVVPLLRPTIATISPATVPGIESFANQAGMLYVRLVPGPADADFTLYDGARISQSADGPSRKIAVQDGTVFRSGTVLEVLRTAEPKSVTESGTALSRLDSQPLLEAADKGWFWDGTAPGTLWIKLPSGAHQVEMSH